MCIFAWISKIIGTNLELFKRNLSLGRIVWDIESLLGREERLIQWELWQGILIPIWKSRDHIEKHQLLRLCCQASQGNGWFKWGGRKRV